MSKLGDTRLLALADHLESDKRGHDRFDLGVFSTSRPYIRNCETAGCALGECPYVFPDHWQFDNACHPVLKGSSKNSPFLDADKFFDLKGSSWCHLFSPDGQNTKIFGGKVLNRDATPQEVAHNIREYVRISNTFWGRLKIWFLG